jgi:hypothetical protein
MYYSAGGTSVCMELVILYSHTCPFIVACHHTLFMLERRQAVIQICFRLSVRKLNSKFGMQFERRRVALLYDTRNVPPVVLCISDTHCLISLSCVSNSLAFAPFSSYASSLSLKPSRIAELNTATVILPTLQNA